MPSHDTYNKDRTTGRLKRDLEGKGEYDADGDKITTYRINSKNKLVRSIDGKLDKTGKPVTKYKHCRADNYYRLDVHGQLDRGQVENARRVVNPVPTTSALTAGIEQQRKADRLQGERDQRVRAAETRKSTGGGSGRRQSPSGGRTLSPEEIARQNRRDIEATPLYHEDGPVRERQDVGSQSSLDLPPSYGNHGRDFRDLQIAGPAAGPHHANAPPYSSNPLSAPGPTGQTPNLSQRLPRDTRPPSSWGGKHNPNAPPGYSSEEAKRGNDLTSSDGSRPYTSGSDNMFAMSGLEDALPPSSSSKAKAPAGKLPKTRPASSSDDSPPRSFLQHGRTGAPSSKRRDPSRDRKPKDKGKQPAKASSSKRHESSSDDRYGS
ncbi:uncharacterized protein EAF02_009201 [Botrytis sinoallii]|uniref:uncharacterized protein n=1 Tax=Botrytis sinoallii TaxID=1463999 RepID=UPI0019000A62|nr:uncharacterized protein EAF02_009201 [Botrytis sinoallii]KAF7872096.1 hypothetical protein EAF02_009201 [Botrytis sinoallii]